MRLLLAIVSGLMLSLAYPGWNIGMAVWLWMFPLLAALWLPQVSSRRPRPFLLGYIAGLAFFFPNVWWVRHSSRVIFGATDHSWIGWGPELLGLTAVTGLAGYCALYFGLWAWFVTRFATPRNEAFARRPSMESLRCAFLVAAFWCGCEWLRGIVLTGFGWNGLGIALHENIKLIQVADVIGVSGLSFVPVFVSSALFNAFHRIAVCSREKRLIRCLLKETAAAIILVAGSLFYGAAKLLENNPPTQSPGESTPLRVAMIQGNIPQAVKWAGEHVVEIYDTYAALTRANAEARDGVTPVDLVIWPESALPMSLFEHEFPDMPKQHPQLFNDILALGDFSLLTGAEVQETPTSPMYTSAVLMRGNFDNRQYHHKVHRVPFGEYLPFRDTLPFMEPIFGSLFPRDFAKGPATEPLHLEKPALQLIPLICFEDTVGRVARKFVRDAPQVIVNLSNDGWFLQSAETEIHLVNSIFRAIELRRPMVRCSNTGVTCVVDACGRITNTLTKGGSTFIEGVLRDEVRVPVNPPTTIYARFGDWFSLSMLLIAIFSGIIGWRKSLLLVKLAINSTGPTA